MIELLGWVGTALCVLASLILAMNAYGLRFGLWASAIANLCLMGYSWRRETYPLVVLYLILMFLSGLPLVSWVSIARWFNFGAWERPRERIRCAVGTHKQLAVSARQSRCRLRTRAAAYAEVKDLGR